MNIVRQKKEKKKKRDLHNVKLSYMQSKNDKSTAKEESSVAFEKSAEHNLGAHTESRNEEHIKTVSSTVELLNGTKSLISGSASGQDDLYFSSTSSFLTPSIVAFDQTGVQETYTDVKGLSTKAKKKKMKYDSHIEESFDVENKTEACTSSQKSPVMNNLECNSMVQNHIVKKDKRKKHDSDNGELLDAQSKANIKDQNCKGNGENRKMCNSQDKVLSDIRNESDKLAAKGQSLVGHYMPVRDQSLGSITGNVDEAQVIATPSVADLLNSLKSKLKVKLPKKHKKDDCDETKSDKNGSHVLAFSHGENKRKKSDKSHPNKKQHNSKKSKDKTSVSFDPMAVLAEYMSKFEATGKDDTANECHSSKEFAADTTTSNTSFRSSFCLTGAGMANATDRKRKKMNKGKGDAMPVRRSLPLPPSSHSCSEAGRPVGQDIVTSHSIKNSKEVSDVNSPKTKDQTPVSSGRHDLNLSKLPTHDKSHGSCSGRELIDASLILPHHSDVLQRLRSPSVDSRRSAGMHVISPLQAESVNKVSTDLVKETVTTEIKDKHKTKKKRKEKKSKTKDYKDREHIGRKQKKKNAQDHKRNKEGELESSLEIHNELVDRREEHKEENIGTKGKQDKSKEKDSNGNLEDLKILTSKLFSSFLQQEKS